MTIYFIFRDLCWIFFCFQSIAIYQSSCSCSSECSQIRVHLQIHVFIEISTHCTLHSGTNECDFDCVMRYLLQLLQFVSCNASRAAFQFRSLSLSLCPFAASSVGQTDQLLLLSHTWGEGNSQALSKHTWAAKIARHTNRGGNWGCAPQRGQPAAKCNLCRESCAHTHRESKLCVCD